MVVLAPAGAAAQAAGTWDQYQGGSTHPGSADGPEPPYRVRWTLPAPSGDALGPAVLDGERAYTLGRGSVFAVDLATGEVSWRIARDGRVLTSPALVPGATPSLLFVDGPSSAGPRGATQLPAPSPSGSTSAGASASPSASASASDATSPSASASATSTTDRTLAASTLVAVDPSNGDERWRTPLPAVSRTGVTVADGVAYVGDQRGGVTAVDLASGAIEWTVDVTTLTKQPPDAPLVVERPLAVGGGTVAVGGGSRDHRTLVVASLDTASGDARWTPLVLPLGDVATAPTIVNDRILVGESDHFVHAYDAEDGSEAWRALTVSQFSPGTTIAATADLVVAVDFTGGIYRLQPASGERLWSFQTNELTIRSAPVSVGGAFLVGLSDGRLVAIDPDSGHLRWQGRSPGLTGAIAVGADVVVVVKGGRDAGLIAYETDPSGTLVDVASPTAPDPSAALGRAAIGAVVAAILVIVPGVLLRRRFEVVAETQPEDDPSDHEDDDE